MNVKFGLFQSLSTNKNISRIILLPFIIAEFFTGSSNQFRNNESEFLQLLISNSFLFFSVRNNLIAYKIRKTSVFAVSELVVGSGEQDIYKHPAWYTYSFSQNMCGVQVENEKQLIIIIDRRVILLNRKNGCGVSRKKIVKIIELVFFKWEIKSDNLKHITIARWLAWTNDSLTKLLMFQAFFFHNFL